MLPEQDYFEGFNAEQAAFIEAETNKVLPMRRRGRPPKVSMDIHDAVVPPQESGSASRIPVDISEEAYDNLFDPDPPTTHPSLWDAQIDLILDVTNVKFPTRSSADEVWLNPLAMCRHRADAASRSVAKSTVHTASLVTHIFYQNKTLSDKICHSIADSKALKSN